MANTEKKYYWLKLKEDFFEDDTIEWIEEQPGGEKYSLFYLKLCLKSLKTNGILIRNVGEMLIPYDIKKLAEITKTDIDTARVAMDIFKNIGLVQILESGAIYMVQLEKMVGSESKWAEKKRLQRSRKKDALPPPEESEDNVLDVSSKCPGEIETEQEKEKEKEKEKDKELTDRERKRIDFLRELFAGWQVNDYQIFYLSTLINKRIPYAAESLDEREFKIYKFLDHLMKKAKAENVKHIYRWLEKVIPVIETEGLDYEEEIPY